MKKFKIIEEGRLDASKLSQIKGGGRLTCESSGTTIYHQCDTTGAAKSSCPISYRSCIGLSNKITCNANGGYSGNAGPAGWITNVNDIIN